MAARGYRYYRTDSFPVDTEFTTMHKSSMFQDMVDDEPSTIITKLGMADHTDFTKYHVMHETYEKVRGRYRNKPIKGYVAQVEFHVYYHVGVSRMFVDTNRKLCAEMIDRLHRSKLDFLGVQEELDLPRLANDLRSDVRGGWFRDLKVADVSTIGLFGTTVGESSEWDRYERVGKLNTIDLELETETSTLPT